MKFNSKSEAVRFYTKELLDDKEIHSTEEIKKYVKEKMNDDDISVGIFSGAIRDLLTKEPQYVNISRGQYRLIEDNSILMLHIKKSLSNAETEIRQELDKINVSSLTEDDFKEIQKAQSILNELNKLMKSI